jgi:hypothetical protein
MSGVEAAPPLLKRLGKMKVKTFLRWVGGAIALIVVFVAGHLLWGHNFFGGSDNDAATQEPPPIRAWTLQAQYKGPLQDTLIQRWIDPDNGDVCYIYLPVIVQHSKPLDNGLVHYDSNAIGSISCPSSK